MSTIETKELIDRAFIKDTEVDDQRLRAKIVRAIIEKDS
jgi:hypothetical protein